MSVASFPCERWNATQVVDVDVGDSVAEGHHERLAVEVGRDLQQSTSRLGVPSRVDQGYAPVFGIPLLRVWFHGARREIDGHVRREGRVLRHVALDVLALVPERDEEIVVSVVRVDLQDVPEDRAVPDLDHRLRTHVRLFRQAGALPPARMIVFIRASPVPCA